MPASMPVICMIDGITLKSDALYLKHMQENHGTQSPDQAMMQEKAKEQNLPKQQPVILDPNAPPSPEFMEVAQMMDQTTKPLQEREESTSSFPSSSVNPVGVNPRPLIIRPNLVTKEGPRPLILKYRYEGDCDKCLSPIRTVIIKAKGQTVAVAFCLEHGELQQKEVQALEEVKIELFTPDLDKMHKDHNEFIKTTDKRKRVKKHARRSKSKFLGENAVQGTLPDSRLPEGSGENLPNQS